MKRHPTDTVSLVFGLIFLGIVGLWVVGLFFDFDIPNFGWIAAVGLIVLGLLGVAASLRGGGRDSREDITTAGTVAAGSAAAENGTSSAWAEPGTDTDIGTTGLTDTRDSDSIQIQVGPDDRPTWPSH